MNAAGFGTEADGSLGAAVATIPFVLDNSVSTPRAERCAGRGIVRAPDNIDVQDALERRGNR